MWTHEESIETSAAPSRVWALFADVARWKDWNAGIESIELHGPFVTGASFTMRPPGQDALTSTLIEVKSNESFIDETVVDETRVLVSHRLVLLPSGRTRIIYNTEISGPDADEIGPMVTNDFPDVLAALKKLAEQS
ncbi:polyketide cyclase/dehydrase/lipid transport protein [Collimonas sp. PA-H2]|uniref:SRPBCC family protein n=1 Tax=Collimonas sp. PA-H2 TaxID=1881062 RepID=UPI000BF3705C|nr:SRPBCC family protein [Collimonas sp. PA-H2]PFH11407.1 polyketide cyclase/dehydrase/lipid transport protein [Collimonas sp. PA-H2]